jgi:phage baseplate assembly protein W
MVNLLHRFSKDVAGSESKLADYKSTVASIGDFRRIDNIQVILNSWSNILTTPRRTYMFDPEYGSDLYKLIFEPADNTTKRAIIDETVSVLTRYDDRARINDINVEFLPNRKGFNVAVDVEYEGETGQIEVIVDEDSYFQFFESSASGA